MGESGDRVTEGIYTADSGGVVCDCGGNRGESDMGENGGVEGVCTDDSDGLVGDERRFFILGRHFTWTRFCLYKWFH